MLATINITPDNAVFQPHNTARHTTQCNCCSMKLNPFLLSYAPNSHWLQDHTAVSLSWKAT